VHARRALIELLEETGCAVVAQMAPQRRDVLRHEAVHVGHRRGAAQQ
jgi:hypothetical protein